MPPRSKLCTTVSCWARQQTAAIVVEAAIVVGGTISPDRADSSLRAGKVETATFAPALPNNPAKRS